MNLATFDIILIIIAGFFSLMSMRHGLLHELAGIIAWIAAATLAYFSYSYLSPLIEIYVIPLILTDEISLDPTYILTIADSISIFLIFIMSGFFISSFLKGMTKSLTSRFPKFGLLERILGGTIFGIIKTLAIVSIAVFIYQDVIAPISNLDVEPHFIVDSFSFYYIEEIIIFAQSIGL